MLYPAIVLDAASAVSDARARLRDDDGRLHAGARVVLRLQIADALCWYACTAAELDAALASWADDTRVSDALALRTSDAWPARQSSELEWANARGLCGVVLDGPRVLGVAELSRSSPYFAQCDALWRPGRDRDPDEGDDGGGGTVAGGRSRWTDERFVARSAIGEPVSEPWRAYAAITAPEVVAPSESFEVSVGLSDKPHDKTVGAVTVPRVAGETRIHLEVQVLADGFDAPDGSRFTLDVDPDNLRGAVGRVRLVARDGTGERLSLILVQFFHRGECRGSAARAITVRGERETLPSRMNGEATAWSGIANAAGGMQLDAAAAPPDLTIIIAKPDGNDASGRFQWTLHSPHDIPLPAAPLAIDLGRDAASFSLALMKRIPPGEGSALGALAVRGVAKRIAEHVPRALFDALRAVYARTGRPPTVQLYTAEAHVPWELAIFPEPLLEADRPPFLGAQATIGRWILGLAQYASPRGEPLDVSAMVAIAGDYAQSTTLRVLGDAIAEANELQQRYDAVICPTTEDAVAELLNGTLPPGGAQSLHFACHGAASPNTPELGAVYVAEDMPLSPFMFSAAPIGELAAPFIFLNACQVGASGELLGGQGGFASACLSAGFRGFVAPVWSVADEPARDFALGFYERVLAEGAAHVSVAEAMRELRARYRDDGETPFRATYLSYVFYGHPSLAMRRRAAAG
ncbi:MAG: CHAT domain-containing protein [Gemmatimonadaceae bacterium]